MTTIRGDLESFQAEVKAESDETQAILAALFGSGSPNVIDTLIAIEAGIDALNSKLTTTNSSLGTINTSLGTINTSIAAIDDNIVAKLEVMRLELADYLQTINTEQIAQTALLDDHIAPMTENIYYAVLGLRALIAATACPCDSTGPVLPPPISVTPITVNAEHCKRVQALIDIWQDASCDIASAVQNGAAISFQLAAVLLGLGVVPGIDLGSIPVGLVTGVIGLMAAGAAAKFDSICEWFDDNKSGLMQVLYAANNASEAQSAFYTYVDAHTGGLFDLDTRLIIKALAWTGTINQLYNPDAEWDTSGYDGSLCLLDASGCLTANSRTTTASGAISGTRRGIDTAPPGMTFINTVNTSSGEVTDTPALFVFGNLLNWELTVLSGSVRIVSREVEPSNTGTFSSSIDFTSANTPVVLSATNHWAMVPSDGSTPFTVKLCQPD